MTMQPEFIKMNSKKYWKTRRTEGHRDWVFGTFRELFQNSIDAGANRVDIQISEADGKGSFGRPAHANRVLRLVFNDNGKGMTEDILRNVFFKLGESTKNTEDSIGGFGTARDMLCFSHIRYGIVTQKSVVEGDGIEFLIHNKESAIEAKKAEIEKAEQQQDQTLSDSLKSQLAELQYLPKNVKGCRVEIDIDLNETEPGWGSKISENSLMRSLRDYLEMSQVSCDVYINGLKTVLQTKKGQVKRELVARLRDGQDVNFAKVYTSKSDSAKHKNAVIVRVDGATMFKEYSQANAQVIVEINKNVAKQVLTDNRDGLKSPYSSTLNAFLQELSTDIQSAMSTKDKRKHLEFKGTEGKLRTYFPKTVKPVSSKGDAEINPSVYVTEEEYQVLNEINSDEKIQKLIESSIEAIAQNNESLIESLMSQLVVVVTYGKELNFNAQKFNKEDVLKFGKLYSERMKLKEDENKDKISGINDIHMQIDDLGEGEKADKLKSAYRRFMPTYWRRKGEEMEGRGMEAHITLMVWRAFVEEALRTAISIKPSLAPAGYLEWAVGWYFGKSEERWNDDIEKYENIRTEAQYQKRGDAHLFLLNPVSDEGKTIYSIYKERRDTPGYTAELEGRQKIKANAIHEVSHIFKRQHNEGFSSFFTEILAHFNHQRADENAQKYIDVITDAYGKGKSRIQILKSSDDDLINVDTNKKTRTIRPAEKLKR